MGNRTWEDNALSTDQMLTQGVDVSILLLVGTSIGPEPGKTTCAQFAAVAHTTAQRIKRYADVWPKLAALGLVPPSSQMTPADALTFKLGQEAHEMFAKLYDPSKAGSRPRAPISEISGALVNKPGYAERFTDELTAEAVAELTANLLRRIRQDRINARTDRDRVAAEQRIRELSEGYAETNEQIIQTNGHAHVLSSMGNASNNLRDALKMLGRLNDEALTALVRSAIDENVQHLSDQLALITRRMSGRDQDWDDALEQLTAAND